MNMEQLCYFAAVVEEGTISGAARRLHMSQPPVSLQLKNLEAEYGVKLFERGARQIRLTEAGKLLYTYAVKIMELKDSAEDEMKSLRTGKQGNLRLGVISSGTCEEFFRGLSDFREKHANIHFKVYDGNTYELLDSLDKQKIELAVVRTPFPGSGLDIVTIRCDSIVAAGREPFISALPEGSLYLKDLKEYPLIVYRRWEKIIRESFEAEHISPDFYCINDDARTSLQWAEAGLGIALLPASVLPLAHQLSARTMSESHLSSSLCLVKKSGRPLSESADAFYRSFQSIFS